MTTERSSPYVWVTWLSKFMAGDVTCDWAPWFKSHYQDWPKAPGDFDLASWKVNHTRLLRDLREKREAMGEQILFEHQTAFKYRRPDSRLVLAGKPDLATVDGSAVRVFDCKTGQQRASDVIQVQIYLYCLKQTNRAYQSKSVEGILVYPDHIVGVPPYSVDDQFVSNFNYFLDVLDQEIPPLKLPSYMECRFCDISKDACPERIEIEAADVG